MKYRFPCCPDLTLYDNTCCSVVLCPYSPQSPCWYWVCCAGIHMYVIPTLSLTGLCHPHFLTDWAACHRHFVTDWAACHCLKPLLHVWLQKLKTDLELVCLCVFNDVHWPCLCREEIWRSWGGCLESRCDPVHVSEWLFAVWWPELEGNYITLQYKVNLWYAKYRNVLRRNPSFINWRLFSTVCSSSIITYGLTVNGYYVLKVYIFLPDLFKADTVFRYMRCAEKLFRQLWLFWKYPQLLPCFYCISYSDIITVTWVDGCTV